MATDFPHAPEPLTRHEAKGFTLLEMMTLMLLILIVASTSIAIFHSIKARAREAVLRDRLFTMRSMMDGFTLDNHRPPESLEELVTAGYLGWIPTDPFTGPNETWQVENEIEPLAPGQLRTGIVDVHSGSDRVSPQGG